MKGIHKLTVALLTVVAISTWNTTFATSMTIDVEGTDSASHSGAISVGTLNKINAGALALSGTNAIGALGIHGGLVSVSAASNLNGASSAVTFAASGTDPVTATANTATLEIGGSMNTGAFAFTSDGTVQVDGANVATLNAAPTGTGLVHKTGAGVMKIASDLGPQTLTYTFDTADGYYKNGSTVIAWPSNFISFNSDLFGFDPYWSVWQTNDTSDNGVSYGGITLWYYPGTDYGGTPIYYSGDPTLAAAHPTTVIPTPIAGINVDAGTLELQAGVAPDTIIRIEAGASMDISGASGTIPGSLVIKAAGCLKLYPTISNSVTSLTLYGFNTSTGLFFTDAGPVPLPAGVTFINNVNEFGSTYSQYYYNSGSELWPIEGIVYNGVLIPAKRSRPGVSPWEPVGWIDVDTYTSQYFMSTVDIFSSVLFQSGSKLVLGDGSNYTRNITVGTAS